MFDIVPPPFGGGRDVFFGPFSGPRSVVHFIGTQAWILDKHE
jgi:hypothetical protein